VFNSSGVFGGDFSGGGDEEQAEMRAAYSE